MTATGLVLLIGCANLANLALARGVSREREVAVRAALGAGRWRLVRQFITENVVLSLAGGVLGIAIGYGFMKWLQLLVPPFSFAREAEITMDVRVLVFALAISAATGLLFGLAPAWQATSPDLSGSMKEGGRGASGSASRKRLRDVLIVAEVALAFVLLVGSGLMMRSFFRLMNVDPGLNSTNVLTIGMPIATERFPDPARLNQYLREIRTAVEAVPGVRETALSCAPPMQGSCYGMPMQVAGRPITDRANRQGGFYKVVSPSYFTTLGLSLRRGRALSDRDVKSAPPALVINERLATREFPNQDPIGQRLLIQEIIPGKTGLGPEIAWEIVGVIRDEKVQGMADDRSAGVYVSNEQSPVYFMTLSVRAHADPLPLQKSISAAIRSVNKDQALNDIRTVDQIKELSMAGNRLQTTLLVDLRHHGADPRGHRHLRRDLVFGGAAHAGDRDSRRSGRHPYQPVAHGAGPGARPDRRRTRHRPRRRAGPDQVDDDHPVRGRRARSGDTGRRWRRCWRRWPRPPAMCPRAVRPRWTRSSRCAANDTIEPGCDRRCRRYSSSANTNSDSPDTIDTYCRLPTRIADRPAVDRRSKIRLPQQRAGARIQRLEVAFPSAREQQVRSRRQDAAVGHVGHLELPLLPARRGIDRDHRAVTGRLGPRIDRGPAQARRARHRRQIPRATAAEVRSFLVLRRRREHRCSRSLPRRRRRRGRCAD